MPRNVTITFGDGSQHLYQNIPDNVTPDQVTARASQDFGKDVTALDGGRRVEQAQAQPQPQQSIMGKIGSALGGIEQGLYDIPQSAIELGARGTDALGLTNGAYPMLHNEFKQASAFADPSLPQGGNAPARVGRIGGEIAGTLPAMALRVPGAAAALPRLAPFINGALQGGASAALTSSASDAPLEDQIALGAGAGLALPTLGLGGKLIKNVGANVLGASTGAGANSIKTAFNAGLQGGEKGAAFTEAMRDPSTWDKVVIDAKQALSNLRAQRSKAYQSGMVDVSKDATVLDFKPVDEAIEGAGGIKTFKGQDLSKSTAGVRKEINDTVAQWKSLDPSEYHTPEGFDALKQQLGDILATQDPSKPSYGVAKAAYDAVKGAIAKQAPGYSKVMSDYSNASEAIKELEKELSLGKKGNPNTALRKLQSVMRDNANTSLGKRTQLASDLENAGATNLMPSLAGQALSSPLPRGLAKYGDLATGLTVGLGSHGAGLLPLAVASSPRLVGELAYGAGSAARGGAALLPNLPPIPQGLLSAPLGVTAPALAYR